MYNELERHSSFVEDGGLELPETFPVSALVPPEGLRNTWTKRLLPLDLDFSPTSSLLRDLLDHSVSISLLAMNLGRELYPASSPFLRGVIIRIASHRRKLSTLEATRKETE